MAKSKRVASREVNGEELSFSCKIVKAILQEDKQDNTDVLDY